MTLREIPPFPRIRLEDLDPPLRDQLAPTVERLGYFGDYFAVVGQNPQALLNFMEYTKAVKAPLSDRHNEVLALVTCTRTGADYERIQHERLSQRLGLPNDWIAELVERRPANPSLLDADEQALRQLVDVILQRPREAGPEIDAIRVRLGDKAALAAVLQITRFALISTILEAFAMQLPVPSPFDS